MKRKLPRTPSKTLSKASQSAKKVPRKQVKIHKNKNKNPPPHEVVEEPDVSSKLFHEPPPTLNVVMTASQAVRDVLEEHVLRFTVPKDEMASICERLEKTYVNRKIDGKDGTPIPLLEAPLDEAFGQFDEKDIGMDKSMFRQELIKYLLIASSRVGMLSKETLMLIARDLEARDVSLFEFEPGAPLTVKSTLYKFCKIEEDAFKELGFLDQLKHKMLYTEKKLEYHKEMESFLKNKHKAVVKKGKSMKKQNRDIYKNYAEGAKMESDLIEAWQRNHDIERHVKIEYEELNSIKRGQAAKYEEAYRLKALRGRIGARKKEEEEQLDSVLFKTQLNLLKIIAGESEIEDETTLKLKEALDRGEYPVNHILLTPAIHSMYDEL